MSSLVLVWIFVGLFLLLLGWSIVAQVIGRARAVAADYAGADFWYGLAFSHRTHLAGRLNIAAFQIRAGQPDVAEPALRALFEEARNRKDARLERVVLVNLGASLSAQRRLGEAAAVLAWAAREEGDPKPEHRAGALYNLAWVAYLEWNFEEAQRLLATARLVLPRPSAMLAAVRALLEGRLATRAGDYEQARTALATAAARAARSPDRGLPGQVELSQGVLEYLAGNHEAGLETVLSNAEHLVAADRGDLAARLMIGLALIARRSGDEAAAAQLEETAARFRGIVPLPSPEDCAAYLETRRL